MQESGSPLRDKWSRSLLLAVLGLLLPAWVEGQSASPAEAMALEQQGKLAEAAEAWIAVTERTPKDAAAFASLGVVLSKQQKYSEAAAAYRKAIALNPLLPGMQLNLGLAEFKQGHFEAAIAPLKAALAADPQSVQATTLLGLSCYGAKHFEEAIKYLAVASASDQGSAELHQVLAQSCLMAKNYPCALEEFRKLQQQDPNSAAVHIFTGEAITEFEAALKLSPKEPNLNFGLGYLYWKAHNYDGAVAGFERELLIDPGNTEALTYLGDIAMKREDPEKARS